MKVLKVFGDLRPLRKDFDKPFQLVEELAKAVQQLYFVYPIV